MRNANDILYRFSKSIMQTSSPIDFIPVRVVSKTRNVAGSDKKWNIENISDKALRTNRILLPNEGRQTRRKKRLRRRERKQRRRSKSLGPKVRKNNLLSELEGLGKKKELYEKIIKTYIKQRVRRRRKKLRSEISSQVPVSPAGPAVSEERRRCGVTSWSSWSPCSVTCGIGEMIRTRSVSPPFLFRGHLVKKNKLKSTKGKRLVQEIK